MSNQPALGDIAIIRRLVAMARPCWGHIAALLALTFLSTPIALLAPVPTAIVVDSVLSGRPLPGFVSAVLPASIEGSDSAILVTALVLTVAIALLRQLIGLGTWLLQVYTGERLVLDFRMRMFRNAQRLPFTFHDKRGVSDSAYRIHYDAGSVQWILLYSFFAIVSALATLLAMFAITARINLALAVVAVTAAPILLLVTALSRRRLKHHWGEVKQLESSALGVVQEALGAGRVVRAFGRENYEEDRLRTIGRAGMRGQLRVSWYEGLVQLAVGLTVASATGVALVLGARLVQSGEITLGELLVVLAYLAALLAPLTTLSQEVANMQGSLVSASRAVALLDESPDVTDPVNGRPVARARGAIAFDNVWYAYEPDRWALRGVSFHVEPGMRVGIQGRTGAGKSTIAALLPRFYDPSVGAVTLDGVDLRDYRLADLRSQYSIVLQDPVLFSTTIEENIAYARPGASHEEIIGAARAANADEFISALPGGYHSLVGERGVSLSGGERQRISLARAFLRDAPVLILDEPTSSVDGETEAGIMDALDRLMAGRTTFIIAHRLATLDGCDVRFLVEHGELRVVPSGPMRTHPRSPRPARMAERGS